MPGSGSGRPRLGERAGLVWVERPRGEEPVGRRRCSRRPSSELRPGGPDPASSRRASAAADKGACRCGAGSVLGPPGGSGHRRARLAPPPPARPVPLAARLAGPASGMEPPLLLPLALLTLLCTGGERGVAALPAGCKHDGRARGTGRAAGAEGKVVCSSLELAQVLPPDTLPNRTVTL